VHAASALFARPGFSPAALVGGLAVTMRLASVHRATNDVDAVTDGEGPRAFALEYLRDSDAHDDNRVEIDGIKIDVMPTEPLPEHAEELPDGDLDRLFVLGHRWALESAGQLSVQVVTSMRDATEPVAIRVATSPALVACKLHAIADRRDARRDKRESDALDLVRLLGDLVRAPALTAELSSAPFDLSDLVASQVERWFIDEPLRTARLINLGAGGTPPIVDPDDISTIGELFVSILRAP
jgi:hypothetical protein